MRGRGKTKVRGYVVATLTVLMGWSCLPDPLEVRNIPPLKPEIVVNTQIIPDESLVVFLTKTFGALEASDDSNPFELINAIAVNDATVILDGPTSSDTLQLLGAGAYGGLELTFNAGDVYTLRVISPSMGTVQATTTVTPRVEFESLSLRRYFNGYDDTLVQVSYSIKDPLERNFYMINVQRLRLQNEIPEQLLNPRVYTRVIDDSGYDGMVITDTLHATPRDYAAGDTVAIFLSNIQEDYYDFIKLRLDNRMGFVEFVSEPVNYPTNVEGGRGFFNLYIPDVRLFVVE